jgi:hypothetical protein
MDPNTQRREIAVRLPPEGEWGKAMQELPTDRQRAFVVAAVELGTNDWRRVAKMAGFSGDDDTLSVTAHRLAHDTRILAAIREESVARLFGTGLLAVSELTKMCTDSDKQIRMRACLAVMNRIGMHEKTEAKIVTEDVTESDENLIKQISAFAKKLGVDPAQLLGFKPVDNTKPIVDAEFTVVDPDADLMG